jgi:small subunit ribosomal protein S1
VAEYFDTLPQRFVPSASRGVDAVFQWDIPGEDAVRNYKKGQEIEAVVLAIDSERERISLGIKQLDKDPFSGWLAEHPKNSIVKGTVTEVDARGAQVDLGDGVIGSLRASELARGRVEDARMVLKVGEEVEAKFTNVDRKNRSVQLSIKAKEVHEEAEAIKDYKSEAGTAPVGTTLGELLKEKMSGGSK